MPEQSLFEPHCTHWPVELQTCIAVGQFEEEVHWTQPRVELHTIPLGHVPPVPQLAPEPLLAPPPLLLPLLLPPLPPSSPLLLLLLPPQPRGVIHTPSAKLARPTKRCFFVRRMTG